MRIAVETFGGPKRVLTPEEVEEREMWMVLDTSHLFLNRILALIERYHRGIAGVHLSEMRKDETGRGTAASAGRRATGIDVLVALRAKGWSGTVTLEYLARVPRPAASRARRRSRSCSPQSESPYSVRR